MPAKLVIQIHSQLRLSPPHPSVQTRLSRPAFFRPHTLSSTCYQVSQTSHLSWTYYYLNHLFVFATLWLLITAGDFIFLKILTSIITSDICHITGIQQTAEQINYNCRFLWVWTHSIVLSSVKNKITFMWIIRINLLNLEKTKDKTLKN